MQEISRDEGRSESVSSLRRISRSGADATPLQHATPARGLAEVLPEEEG